MAKIDQKTPEGQLRIAMIMNDVPEKGAKIVAHCVPTRAFRVLMMKGEKVFRVEQLNSSTWTWTALSTHAGTDPWESYGAALTDACAKQDEFALKVQKERLSQKQAALTFAATNGARLQ